MFEPVYKKRVMPLAPGQGATLRVWLKAASQIPAPDYCGAQPLTWEQAMLLLSLTYGAGVQAHELAAMRVEALLDAHGAPASHVHIRPETTKHRVSRKVVMHPDICRDLCAFLLRHGGERWVAFVPLGSDPPEPRHMSAHGLSEWFRSLYREVGLDGLTVRSGIKAYADSRVRI